MRASAECLDLAVAVQQIPAPTGAETKRSSWVRDEFSRAGLADVTQDELGNVYGRVPGGANPALIVSAHLDTVFPAETDLTLTRTGDRIAGPGIADNSLGVAALIWLARSLREERVSLPVDLWLVANVREEGNGDLQGMKMVMDRLGSATGAVIVLEGAGLGRVVHQGVGSRRYRITAIAPGGHSWDDFGAASAVHELVCFAERLTHLCVPADPRTTYNIGLIQGGRSVNTIAESACLELDLRSVSAEVLQRLAADVEAMVATSSDPARGVEVTAEIIGDRPVGAIADDHALVRICRAVLDALGVEVHTRPASTDANIPLSRGIPAVCIGLTKAGHVHRESEYLLSDPLQNGLRQLREVITRTSELCGQPCRT
jgi:tripeptide aminopeptidase